MFVKIAKKENLYLLRCTFCLRSADDANKRRVIWTTLEHKGPVFSPRYKRLPGDITMWYDGKPTHLKEAAEEAAVFYARALNYRWSMDRLFKKNFFASWKKVQFTLNYLNFHK